MKTCLTIILILTSASSFAVVGLTSGRTQIRTLTTVPIAVATIPPVVPIDTSSLEIFSSSRYFNTCDLGSALPPDFMSMIDSLYTRCESRVERAMLQSTHAEKLSVLATEACPCFNEGTSLYSMISPQSVDRDRGNRGTHSRGILGLGRQDPPPGEEQIISSVNKANTHLADLRNGIMFQASILSADPQIMEGLARVYSNGFYQNATTAFTEANSRLQTEFRRPADRRNLTLDASLQIPAYNPNILIGNAPTPSCVSMRDFRSYRQFPEDGAFYQDLLSPRHASFQPREWSFPKLKESLRNLSRDNNILTLDEAKNDPRTGWIVRRLDFLNRNPLLKNLMSGTGRNGKEELFNLVMNTFKPENANCAQSGGIAHACQIQAVKKAQTFRDGLLGIFRRPDVAERVAHESQEELNDSLRTLPQMVTRAHNIPTAAELQVFNPAAFRRIEELRGEQANFQHSAADQERERTEGDRLLRLRVSSMNQMCPRIETSNSLKGNYVVNELEGQWADEIQEPVFDGESFSNNKSFDEFRRNICNRSSGDDQITYAQFMQQNCFNAPTPCVNPMAMYIRRYPSGADIDQATVFAEFSVRAPVGNLGTTAVASVASASGQSYQEHVRSINTDLQSTFSGSSGGSSSRTASVTPVTSSSTAALANPSMNNNNPIAAINPILAPEVFQPQAVAPVEARAEVLRREVRENDSQAQGIRDEISGLREVLTRPDTPRDDQNYQDLTARFASLERRLADTERRKSSAEEELRRISNRNDDLERVNGRAAAAQPIVAPSSRSPVAATTTGGAVSRMQMAPQSGAASGGGMSSSAFSPSSSSIPSTLARAPLSAAGSALLVKYGVQPSGLQGALIVAGSGSAVDLQRLRADSQDSTLPITIPLEEYNQIASNNQEALRPYLDRCRAMAGDVCRLSISAQNSQIAMELFVLKTDGEYSIVQSSGAGRAIASERPLPEISRSRDATLNGLRSEFAQ